MFRRGRKKPHKSPAIKIIVFTRGCLRSLNVRSHEYLLKDKHLLTLSKCKAVSKCLHVFLATPTGSSGCRLFERKGKKKTCVATGQQHCWNLSSCQAQNQMKAYFHVHQINLGFLIWFCIYLFITCKKRRDVPYVGWHLIEFPHLASGEFVFGAH